MEKPKNKNIRKGLATAGLGFAGVLLLSSCEDTRDYAGSGDEFVVAGIVLDIQEDGTIQIDEEQLVIQAASGKASSWFSHKKGQDTLSSRFNFEPSYTELELGFFGDCESEVTVGRVYNVEGTEITAQDLKPGQTIVIDGSIRETTYWIGGKYAHCSTKDRPVYDEVSVINTPLAQIAG